MELLPELGGKFLHTGEAAVLRDLVNIEIRIRQQFKRLLQPDFSYKARHIPSCMLFQLIVQLDSRAAKVLRDRIRILLQTMFLHIRNEPMSIFVASVITVLPGVHQIGEEQREHGAQLKRLAKSSVRILLYDRRQKRLSVKAVSQREKYVIFPSIFRLMKKFRQEILILIKL